MKELIETAILDKNKYKKKQVRRKQNIFENTTICSTEKCGEPARQTVEFYCLSPLKLQQRFRGFSVCYEDPLAAANQTYSAEEQLSTAAFEALKNFIFRCLIFKGGSK